MPRRKTPRKQRQYDDLAVLDYIETYKAAHNNRAPSQRRIYAALSMSAPSVAHAIVHRLARGGLIRISEHERGVASDLELTGDGYERLRSWRSQQGRLTQPGSGGEAIERGAA